MNYEISQIFEAVIKVHVKSKVLFGDESIIYEFSVIIEKSAHKYRLYFLKSEQQPTLKALRVIIVCYRSRQRTYNLTFYSCIFLQFVF